MAAQIGSASHLVSDGFGAAPLQQNLLDTAGTGHAEALGPLQFGLGVNRLGSAGNERREKTAEMREMTPCRKMAVEISL